LIALKHLRHFLCLRQLLLHVKMQTFRTSEFNLAAFCLCDGAELKAIDKTEKRAVFELLIRVSPTEITRAFWADTPVPVNQFVAAQTELKKRLFSDSF